MKTTKIKLIGGDEFTVKAAKTRMKDGIIYFLDKNGSAVFFCQSSMLVYAKVEK